MNGNFARDSNPGDTSQTQEGMTEEDFNHFKSMKLNRSLCYRSVKSVHSINVQTDFLSSLTCAACGSMIIDEYLVCKTRGHLTCGDCATQDRIVSCAHRLFAKSKDVDMKTGENGDCRKEDAQQICGGGLVSLPNEFINRLLSRISLKCPYSAQGCTKIVPGPKMRKHYNVECPYRPMQNQDQPKRTSSRGPSPTRGKPFYRRQSSPFSGFKQYGSGFTCNSQEFD